MSPDLFVERDLARLASFTVEAIVQRRAGGTEVYEGATKRRSTVLESEEVAAIRSAFDLASYTSRVMQRQLSTQFNIPPTITMRAPTKGVLLFSIKEDEVAFLVIALDHRVRLPLALFMRRFLSEAPFHPL